MSSVEFPYEIMVEQCNLVIDPMIDVDPDYELEIRKELQANNEDDEQWKKEIDVPIVVTRMKLYSLALSKASKKFSGAMLVFEYKYLESPDNTERILMKVLMATPDAEVAWKKIQLLAANEPNRQIHTYNTKLQTG